MPPPAASLLADIGFDCSDEELFKSLNKINSGLPLPGNVIADVNPYNYLPSNLPDSIWYLIHSKDNANVGHGFWKIKGQARLFSNSDITGWRTTLEFFEGQAPNAGKTDWLMHEYWITRKGLGESGQVKDERSLCRVFLGGELDRDQRNTAGRPRDHYVEDLLEIDKILDEHDYLELLDLDNDDAASPSSSNSSSCLTMSSDETGSFDSLDLLQKLEAEQLPSQEPCQKVDHCKSRVFASVKPDKVVILPDSPGLSVSAEVRNLGTDSLLPGSTNCDSNKDVDDKVKRQSSVKKEEVHHRDEGPSSNSNEVGPSSRIQNVSPSGRKRDAKISIMKRLKRKYSCFMPFHLYL